MTRQTEQHLYAIKPKMSGGQQGWFAELRRQGADYRKCFTVSRYGSTEAALKAAIDWRDKLVETVMPMTLAEYSRIERRNNTSGYPGVYFMRTPKKNKAGQIRLHYAWEARTPAGIKPSQKKSFSLLKYGDDKAYELAVDARKKFVAQLDGYWLKAVLAQLQKDGLY